MTTPTKPALPEPSEPSKLLSRVLHELAGAASLCWEPKPTGVFDSQRAIGFVEQAIAELCTAIEAAVAEARVVPEQPIDMILHCPACGMQHIDAPEFNGTREDKFPAFGEDPAMSWTNPPHRSHKCHGCGHIWRPADVPTNGVDAIKTKGKADAPLGDDSRTNMSDTTKPAQPEPVAKIVALAAEHAKADRARFECERYIACYEDGPEEQADLRRLTAASATAYEAFVSGISAAIDAAVAEARAETEALKSDIADALATIAVYEAEARAVPDTLCQQLQQQCSDWGVYWRAPDAHGVNLSLEQAHELLRSALGVEVEIATPSPAEQPKPVARDDAGVSCMCVVTGCRAGPGCPHYSSHCKKHIAALSGEQP